MTRCVGIVHPPLGSGNAGALRFLTMSKVAGTRYLCWTVPPLRKAIAEPHRPGSGQPATMTPDSTSACPPAGCPASSAAVRLPHALPDHPRGFGLVPSARTASSRSWPSSSCRLSRPRQAAPAARRPRRPHLRRRLRSRRRRAGEPSAGPRGAVVASGQASAPLTGRSPSATNLRTSVPVASLPTGRAPLGRRRAPAQALMFKGSDEVCSTATPAVVSSGSCWLWPVFLPIPTTGLDPRVPSVCIRSPGGASGGGCSGVHDDHRRP